ncbi:murein biosynthesis integral membrane protein MurJ [Alkaliphilus serpentinus]|nr:murein biosynthesis integral membrane protein MurJ [Alkaliphilus serpentinus]
MANRDKLAKSAVIVMLIVLISKAMGFIRDVLIASNFGAGDLTDTFFIVFKASSIAIILINSVIQTTLMPVLTDVAGNKVKGKEIDFLNEIINASIILTGILTLLGWIFSPQIIELLAPGFSEQQFQLAVQLNRMGLPIIIIVAVTSIISIYLQSNRQFTIPAATGIVLNIFFIGFLTLMAHSYGLKGLIIAMLLGHLAQLIFQLPWAYGYGYRYQPKISFVNPYVKKTVLLAMPVILGTAVQQVNTIIDRNLASRLTAGSISALSYAAKLEDLIVGVFILTIATIFFPILSKEFVEENYGRMKYVMGYGINLILLVTIPATVGILLLSYPIVQLLFERNEFRQQATYMTSQALLYYSLGLSGIGIREILSKMFYSLQDTKTPMINGMITVAINIILNLLFVGRLQHRGLALATSISIIISAILLAISLRKKVGNIGGRHIITTMGKISFSSIVMGLVVFLLKENLLIYMDGGFMKTSAILGFIIFTGIIIYIGVCYLLRVKELMEIIEKTIKWIRLDKILQGRK